MSSTLGVCFFQGCWTRLLIRPHIWAMATPSQLTSFPLPGASFLYTSLQRPLCKASFHLSTPLIKILLSSCCPEERKRALPGVRASPGHQLTPPIPSAACAPAPEANVPLLLSAGTSPSRALAHARSQPTLPTRHLCPFYTFQGSA